MINLTLDKKIKIGSRVVYISPTQTFTDNKNDDKRYTDIDVSKAVGTVLEICNMFQKNYRVEFDDVLFLPQELQYIKKWYVKQHAVEAL